MHASYSGDLLQAKVQCQHSDTITDDRLLVGENDILCQSLPAGTVSPKPPNCCSISSDQVNCLPRVPSQPTRGKRVNVARIHSLLTTLISGEQESTKLV